MSMNMSRAVPVRPSWRERARRPEPGELVQVLIVGGPKQAAAVARALGTVVVVTGMSHHVHDQEPQQAAGGPVIRLEVTCYPPRPGGAL